MMKEKFDVYFFMKGGHIIKAPDVTDVTMKRDNTTGAYIGYDLTWANPKNAPKMFTLSIPDIVAVSTVKP